MYAHRTSIPLAMTLLVSPEMHVMLGNGMGMAGWFFPLAFGFVAALHLLSLHAYDDIYHGRAGSGSTEYTFLNTVLGPWLPLVTGLGSRAVFFGSAATVALVTAGFVFNEVFVYWFANFGFAFLLVATLLVIQLVGQRFAILVQNILISVVLALLVVLIFAGITHLPSPLVEGEIAFQGRGLVLPFLMVVGVEFAFLGHAEGQDGQPKLSSLVWALLAVLMVFVLWGLMMASFVDPERLAQSFNPHMLAARKVLGQPGRLIMGAALIAGVAALVNGLLLILRSQLAELLPATLSGGARKKHWWNKLGIFLLAGIPAMMMASGMAGEERIDVFIRVALVLWLLHYSLVHLVFAITVRKRKWRHYITGGILTLAALFLGWTDAEPLIFLKSFVMIVLFAGAVGLIIIQMNKIIQGGLK